MRHSLLKNEIILLSRFNLYILSNARQEGYISYDSLIGQHKQVMKMKPEKLYPMEGGFTTAVYEGTAWNTEHVIAFVCMCVCMHHGAHVEVRGQFWV